MVTLGSSKSANFRDHHCFHHFLGVTTAVNTPAMTMARWSSSGSWCTFMSSITPRCRTRGRSQVEPMISNDGALFLRRNPNRGLDDSGSLRMQHIKTSKVGTAGIDDPISAGVPGPRVSMLSTIAHWHVTMSESWQAQPDLAILAIHSFRKDSPKRAEE